ncbi:Uncharacterised protein g2046 [Pycnogonum litorale]
MANRLFETAEHTALYKKYRLSVPSNVISPILKFMSKSLDPPFDYAIDVCCGSGQSTEVLSEHFLRVTGVDISENQLKNASNSKTRPSNVHYCVGDAENLAFVKNNEVDLLTVCHGFHWLSNRDNFLSEVQRILKPGGTLAIYGYERIYRISSNLCNESQNECLTQIIENLFKVELKSYWGPILSFIQSNFQGVVLPFLETRSVMSRWNIKEI